MLHAIKLVYNDHPKDPKILTVVDKWSLFSKILLKYSVIKFRKPFLNNYLSQHLNLLLPHVTNGVKQSWTTLDKANSISIVCHRTHLGDLEGWRGGGSVMCWVRISPLWRGQKRPSIRPTRRQRRNIKMGERRNFSFFHTFFDQTIEFWQKSVMEVSIKKKREKRRKKVHFCQQIFEDAVFFRCRIKKDIFSDQTCEKLLLSLQDQNFCICYVLISNMHSINFCKNFWTYISHSNIIRDNHHRFLLNIIFQMRLLQEDLWMC